ncbi:protein kinase [Streptomyces sp. NBC_00237]|uniref:serine/threonine-protein kinase n=1 Tax=Streptomyces sp. NBC_00237 TaxID=2975687 RepID=UPI00225B2386|nr:serine/threonine-protein kinase [Streptomyces sp. NBC_00237]MCX5201996.1 protein kinase [Streptomyces sp. NBC_00237]
MTGPLLPGDPERLGRIRLLGRLGAGGMGQVFLGRTAGGRLVAVKTVHAHLAAEPHYRERFRREAAAARAVTGAYTAAVLDADPDAEVPWLATAYLPGVTLRRTVAGAGPLPTPAVRACGAALAEALAAIHAAGIVHRDLKPSNVLVTVDGPRVIDFGIARLTGESRSPFSALTAAEDIIGTPGFIAPEQITEGIAITPATDVFALGAVLVFAATGEGPFGRAGAAVMLYRAVHDEPDLSEVPWEIRELAARCLDKSPPRRPAVPEVLAELKEAGAPLWWREGPVGDLVRESGAVPPGVGAEARSGPPGAEARPDADRAAGAAGAAAAARVRRRAVGRRTLLGAAGAGSLGLVAWAGIRAFGKGAEQPPALDWALTGGSEAAGAVRWSRTAQDAVVDGVLVPGGTAGVLLAHGSDGTGSSVGAVHALDTSDGSRRWSVESRAEVPRMWGVVGGVLVAPEVRSAGEVAAGVGLRGGGDVRVKGIGTVPPKWFVGSGDGVVAYTESGSKNLTGPSWEVGLSPPWGRPALAGSSLLVVPSEPGPQPVTCFDVSDGGVRWKHRQIEEPVVATGTDGRRFHLLTASGDLHVLDVRTGVRLAERSLRLRPGAGASALAYANGTGLAHADGFVTGFDPVSGERRWQVPSTGLESSWRLLPGGTGYAPTVAGGLLLGWSDADTVHAVKLADGTRQWKGAVRGGGAGPRPPVVAGGTVYAAAGAACTAFAPDTGVPARTWGTTGTITDLAADATGWYARLDKRTVQAVNRV